MRTYVFVSIFDGTEVMINAPSLDVAWQKLQDSGHRKENYMLEGAQG